MLEPKNELSTEAITQIAKQTKEELSHVQYYPTPDIQQAYSQYLQSFYWDYYATFTFRRIRHDGTNAVYAVWSRLPNVSRAFFAVERFKLDGIHLHALLQSASLANPQFASTPGRIQAYTTKTFGWSKVEWVGGSAGVADYCSKYVTKGNDYFFLGDKYWWKK